MSKPRIFKFGGASVKNPDGIRNVANIIQHFTDQPLLVVVSAMDKTTNELERLAALARACREEEAWAQLARITGFHTAVARDVFESQPELLAEVTEKLDKYYGEIQRIVQGIILLGEFPERTYDRIVAYGELLASVILHAYVRTLQSRAAWLDVRTVIRTDASYTQARVIWTQTRKNMEQVVIPLIGQAGIVITQGFIASSLDGRITTLGREGSDYTAAIFANCLHAEGVSIWKDVPGVLNGDPRILTDTIKLEQLPYEMAVEMTYYGASVIHPKTLKPLHEQHIPLHVRCFLDMNSRGTTIGDSAAEVYTPIRTQVSNVVLLRARSRDLSFLEDSTIQRLYTAVAQAGLQVYLTQSGAVSLTLAVRNDAEAIGQFRSRLADHFNIEMQEGKTLHSVINFGNHDLRAVNDALIFQKDARRLLYIL